MAQFSTCRKIGKSLWSSFLEGDKGAFTRIYESHFELLYEYGLRLHPADAALIKDCIQELFIKLWNNRQNLSDTNNVKAYLFATLRNTLINKLDQEKRRAKREKQTYQLIHFSLHYTVENPFFESEEQACRKKQMMKALNQLTPRQKESIFLRYYAGLEYKEIADIMQLSVKASYKLIGRAIGAMRIHLKEMALYSFLLLLWVISL